jgi:serine/tyrosine/threonine adenylyltransferase
MNMLNESVIARPAFESRFTEQLPGDPLDENRPRQVSGACYSRVAPTAVRAPRLIACSPEVAAMLDLTPGYCASIEFLQAMAGNRVLPGMDPHAMCYGGHQFGSWAGQLGDGRAINLGEIVNERAERYVLQLKGAGPTPYSRSADGRAVLRSSVREFLCSEAMHHLGIPTTRALSLVATGEQVVRDMFYDGNPVPEPGAIVCRVAPSFVRFGNFEIFAARGEHELLRRLADYTILNDYPHLGAPSREVYLHWFAEVCRRTVETVVHWMRVGFVHGVMNTDNMSVLGVTIDYGPYGWLENVDNEWTPNTTDASGRRYAYGNQPGIALWNLSRFGSALHALIGDVEPLQQAMNTCVADYERQWNAMLAAKLGLAGICDAQDMALITGLQALLPRVETDMTIFYRALGDIVLLSDRRDSIDDAELLAPLDRAYYVESQLTDSYRADLSAWLRRYLARLATDGVAPPARRAAMNRVNPKYVLRNYLAQLAIDKAEQGDDSMIHELLDVLRHPYDEQPGRERFAERRPDWARRRAGCSMLSCSS